MFGATSATFPQTIFVANRDSLSRYLILIASLATLRILSNERYRDVVVIAMGEHLLSSFGSIVALPGEFEDAASLMMKDPAGRADAFTVLEEQFLMLGVALLGPDWEQVAKLMGSRKVSIGTPGCALGSRRWALAAPRAHDVVIAGIRGPAPLRDAAALQSIAGHPADAVR